MHTRGSVSSHTIQLLIIGVVLIFVALFIIIQTADIISHSGRFIILKYYIPMCLGGVALAGGYYLQQIHKNTFAIITGVIGSILILYPLILLSIQLGIIKGICMYIIQFIAIFATLMVAYVTFVGVILIIVFIVGNEMRLSDKWYRVISVDKLEINYVLCHNDYTYVDREGNQYYLQKGYLVRSGDNKYFEFY